MKALCVKMYKRKMKIWMRYKNFTIIGIYTHAPMMSVSFPVPEKTLRLSGNQHAHTWNTFFFSSPKHTKRLFFFNYDNIFFFFVGFRTLLCNDTHTHNNFFGPWLSPLTERRKKKKQRIMINKSKEKEGRRRWKSITFLVYTIQSQLKIERAEGDGNF